MKNLLLSLLAFIFLSFLFLYPNTYTPTLTHAQSSEDLARQLQDKQAEISKLETQLAETRTKEKTLKSQLNLIDGQMQVTTLKIEETNLRIEKLKREISDLSTRIERIGNTLDTLSEVLLRRIVQTYKYSNALSTIDLLFSSHGFADLIERLKYIQVAQAYDKQKLYELQATKLAYNDQKQDKETRQAEAEKLNKELEAYKVQLAQQKKDKDELLKITKNDEARYQTLIAQLKADAQAILNAISNVGVKLGDVNKGDIIGYQGNTGCVDPPPPGGHHLHFEVYKDAKVSGGAIVDINTGENIQFKYSAHLVNPKQTLDEKLANGAWAKPISVYPNGISQEFGVISRLGYHTGLDIAGAIGSAIYTVDKGVNYMAGGSVCDGPMNYPPGTTTPARGRIVDHQNGFVTLYWHTTN